ncbi:hypothetical protein GW916_15605 [bacterium]|nr:hypothetical protein [bacterium]
MLFYHNGQEIPTAPPIDPDDVEAFYGVDWSAELEPGETILSSTWIADPTATTADNGFSGAITSVKISGAIDGQTYRITNRISTNFRASIDKSFDLPCKQL